MSKLLKYLFLCGVLLNGALFAAPPESIEQQHIQQIEQQQHIQQIEQQHNQQIDQQMDQLYGVPYEVQQAHPQEG